MSKYTTGELAKLCGISVRTVQYYDTKGLLHPSELTEGGRRLYSEADRKQMQLICFFKSLGLTLDAIKDILESTHPQKVLTLLLDEQEKLLDAEIADKTTQKSVICAVRECIAKEHILPENLCSDIEQIMMETKQKKLRRLHGTMLALGSLCSLTEIAGVLLWALRGNWLLFAASIPAVLVVCALLTRMYYRNTAYACSECGRVFRPALGEFLFSGHTPKARKLTCAHCHKKCWCIETYDGK